MTKSLGKGLEALIPGWTAKPDTKAEHIEHIPIERLKPAARQPRTIFHEETIQQLADSIKDKGIIQPIIVIPTAEGFEIIAGERRYRAAMRAGLEKVPAIVKRYNEEERFELALLENLQREDLSAIDEAEAYKYLMTHYGLNQEELAKKVKKKRSSIANSVRLLSLSDEIQNEIQKGVVSAGQARALLSISNPKERMQIFKKIKHSDVSVRTLEAIAKSATKGAKTKKHSAYATEIRAVEEELIHKLGTKVQISSQGKGKKIKGGINIRFTSLEDLNRILDIILSKRR